MCRPLHNQHHTVPDTHFKEPRFFEGWSLEARVCVNVHQKEGKQDTMLNLF